jgi:hypothetical protein
MGWCGTRERSWLRHYATSRKTAGSISDDVDFLNLPNPSSRIMALGSSQPLREMSTRNLPWGKEGRASKADNLTAMRKYGRFDISQPYGPSRPVTRIALPFTHRTDEPQSQAAYQKRPHELYPAVHSQQITGLHQVRLSNHRTRT